MVMGSTVTMREETLPDSIWSLRSWIVGKQAPMGSVENGLNRGTRDAARALGHHLGNCLCPARPKAGPMRLEGLKVEAPVAKVRGFLALSGGCCDNACCPAEGSPVVG